MSALEDIAQLAGVTVVDVVRNLPAGEVTCVDGEHFVTVLQDMRDWGEITFIVNTGDVILEVKALMSDGSMGRGFYNFSEKPLSGHLNAGACEMIAFASRKFMGKDTHSVQFYHKDGSCMFKVYLGRDAERNFLPGQVDRYSALRDKLKG